MGGALATAGNFHARNQSLPVWAGRSLAGSGRRLGRGRPAFPDAGTWGQAARCRYQVAVAAIPSSNDVGSLQKRPSNFEASTRNGRCHW